MSNNFELIHIEEPSLLFGYNQEVKDPQQFREKNKSIKNKEVTTDQKKFFGLKLKL